MLATLTIPGYELTEIIHEGTNTIVLRGRSQSDQQPVIVKVLKANSPTLEQINRLRHEYKITEKLDLEGIVKVHQLVILQDRLALISEDFGGQSLREWLTDEIGRQESGQTLTAFLKVAIQLARSLQSLQQHRILHKDIKPDNIIINPQTEQVKLTDFGIASRLSKETPQWMNPNQLEGTLAYMSPEQTGRMNRTVDYRSDFYSLGVTFYEMLTGRLPFDSDDPLELVYCHIAREPIPIQQLNPSVSDVVAAITAKLMAKNAEDRYQSATGLLADLQNCLDQLETTGNIANFVPGRLDILSQLMIPQKLYGREREVGILLEAFERVASGGHGELRVKSEELRVKSETHSQFLTLNSQFKSELVLVSGYSGIGKSSVVNEINKLIAKQRGYFISGKFDQFKRNIPYASMIQAFEGLMRQLLAESSDRLQTWRNKLLTALGENGQIIIDVIPELELVIGQQPPVAHLGPTESQNRFNQVFHKFIQVFTQKEHPLVIFLDDLQWADFATLKLMQLLLTAPTSCYLLFIGAYRDNEVSSTHPLLETIQEIQKSGTLVHHIVLQPLNLDSVVQLVSETLKDSAERVQPLAKLMWNQTGGNPFFLTQLLHTLHLENILTFNFETASWQWDITEAQTVEMIDKDVVELVASRIQKLPEATQQVLKLAACVGDKFTLDILAIVSERSPSATANALYPALQAGFILPLSKDYKIPLLFDAGIDQSEKTAQSRIQGLTSELFKVSYKFSHDRVQQAAYSLIPELQKKAVHLKVGRLLLGNLSPEEIKSKIFEIVNQLNVGIDLITEQPERDKLAKLNLIAAQKAKEATAHQSAIKYVNTGLDLLASNSWESAYALTLALYTEAVEVEFALTHFDRTQELATVVLQNARDSLDKAKIYLTQIHLYGVTQQALKSIETAFEAMEVLGIEICPLPPKTEADKVSVSLTLPTLETVESFPEMTDPQILAAMDILVALNPVAYLADFEVLHQIVLTEITLGLQYGHCPQSASAYVWYGAILCGAIGDIELGYHAGQLGLKLLEKYDAKEIKCIVHNLNAANIRHWKEHAKETLPRLTLAVESALDIGDFAWAGNTAMEYCHQAFWVENSLETVKHAQQKIIDLLVQLRQDATLSYAAVWRQLVLNLQGDAADLSQLIGESYSEIDTLPVLQETSNRGALCCLYLVKTILHYLLADYAQAVENAELAAEHTEVVVGSMLVSGHNFYESLALLAHCAETNSDEQKHYLQRVVANQKRCGIGQTMPQ